MPFRFKFHLFFSPITKKPPNPHTNPKQQYVLVSNFLLVSSCLLHSARLPVFVFWDRLILAIGKT